MSGDHYHQHQHQQQQQHVNTIYKHKKKRKKNRRIQVPPHTVNSLEEQQNKIEFHIETPMRSLSSIHCHHIC